jgi:hypothetical protein
MSPTKHTPMNAARKLLLDRLKERQMEKTKERNGFIPDDGTPWGSSTKTRKVEMEGMARYVNERAGGDARKGGPLIGFTASV